MGKAGVLEYSEELIALIPQTVTDGGSAFSSTILRPDRDGHVMVVRVLGGDLTGVTLLAITIQGRNDNGAFEDVLDKDGDPLVFTAAKTIAGGDLDSGQIQGVVPIARLAFEDYRFKFEPVGADALLAANVSIGNLYSRPSDTDDDLILKVFDPGD